MISRHIESALWLGSIEERYYLARINNNKVFTAVTLLPPPGVKSSPPPLPPPPRVVVVIAVNQNHFFLSCRRCYELVRQHNCIYLPAAHNDTMLQRRPLPFPPHLSESTDFRWTPPLHAVIAEL